MNKYVLNKFKKAQVLLIASVCFFMSINPMSSLYANEVSDPQTPSGIPFSEIEQEIDTFMNEHIGSTIPGAAIVIVHEGEIIFSRGYGYTDMSNSISIDPATTVFEYGSVSKISTWVAVMQLVEQGMIDLDADIHNYLPEYFSERMAFEHTFTMRDLLNHAAGFADIQLEAAFDAQQIEENITLHDGLIRIQPRQIFEPGTASAYSNFGTGLAGFVVEYMTDTCFAAYERTHIFLPSGMQNTLNQPEWFGNDDFSVNLATPHTRDAAGNFSEAPLFYSPMYPAGTIRGTAEDLARFAIALMPEPGESGPLFENRESLDNMFSPSYDDPSILQGTHHGLGLRHRPTAMGTPVYTQLGGTLGSFSSFAIAPEEGFGIILLTNNDANTTGMMAMSRDFTHLLLGFQFEETAPITNDVSLPHAESVAGTYIPLRRFAGDWTEFLFYLSLPMFSTTITAIDENTIQINSGESAVIYQQIAPYVFQLVPEYPYTYAMRAAASQLQFRMENGQVTIVSRSGGTNDLSAIPSGRSTSILLGSAAVVLISILFFLITPIVALIRYLIGMVKKNNTMTRFKRLNLALLLTGMFLIINNLILIIGTLSNPFRTAASIAPHIWVNYVFAALFVILFISSIMVWRKENEGIGRKSKALYITTSCVLVLLVLTLAHWNFFVTLT